MTILALRTDRPEAQIYLFEDHKPVAKLHWQAHLKLAETLNSKIQALIDKAGVSYAELNGIAVFKGSGSFTGLRIGMSVANALAFGLELPVVAAGGDDWQKTAIAKLLAGKSDKIALPKYGAPVHVTKPKK